MGITKFFNSKIFKTPCHKYLLIAGVLITVSSYILKMCKCIHKNHSSPQFSDICFIGWCRNFVKLDWAVTVITLIAGLLVIFTAYTFKSKIHKYSMYVDMLVVGSLCLIALYVLMTRNFVLDSTTESYVNAHLGKDLKPDADYDYVQMKLVCCAKLGPIDYITTPESVPASCCGKLKGKCDIYKANSKGCYKLLYKQFQQTETNRALFTYLGRAPGFAVVFFLHKMKSNELANAEKLLASSA